MEEFFLNVKRPENLAIWDNMPKYVQPLASFKREYCFHLEMGILLNNILVDTWLLRARICLTSKFMVSSVAHRHTSANDLDLKP